MKTRGAWLLALALAVPLLASLGVSWASEEEQLSAAPAGPMSSMLVGRIAAIEGDLYLVQEGGDEGVRVTVTPETITAGGFKVGDWVIASVLPDGNAAAMSPLTERGSPSPLRVEPSAIEPAEDK